MKIIGIDLFPIELECTHPGGPRQPDVRQHLIVKLSTDKQLLGWGEITGYGARSLMSPNVDDLGESLAHLIIGENPFELARIHQLLATHLTGAMRAGAIICGIDLALHDLIGKALQVPVHALLGGRYHDRIEVAYPIPAHTCLGDVPASLAFMELMLSRGFALVRFYIGLNLEADAHCLELMRERFGEAVKIKVLDCNGHMDWKTARAAIRRFHDYGFMYVESPARRGDLEGLREVRRAIDAPVSEHAYTLADAAKLLQSQAVDIFNITTVGAGGIYQARKIAAVAEAAGVRCVLGAAHETSLGTAGQIQLGASMTNLDYPVDCIGPEIYASDIAMGGLEYAGGFVTVPTGIGLGIEVGEAILKEHMTFEDLEDARSSQ